MSTQVLEEPFPEADCFRIYRDIRASVPASSAQLGQGYNRYPTSRVLIDFLQTCIRSLADSGRLADYTTDADDVDRALFAALAARRFGLDGITGADVFFTNGASEAISITLGALKATGLGLLLPVPTYYAYEQSALRSGVRVQGRYRSDGRREGGAAERLAAVSVMPNGVAGDLFADPTEVTAAEFRLVDIVFQIAARSTMNALDLRMRSTLKRLDMTRGALILTPAKDLSLPALRTGVLITRHEGLRVYAARDRYERTFSLSPLVAQLSLLYGAVSLLYVREASGGEAGFDTEYAWLARCFAEHGCTVLPAWEECRDLIHHLGEMTEHFERSVNILLGYPDVIVPSSIADRVAGYSCFPELAVGRADAETLARWANHCGVQHQLKLNPTVLFGGTTRTWNDLVEGEARIRINLSVPHAELRACMDLLRSCLPSFGRFRSSRGAAETVLTMGEER